MICYSRCPISLYIEEIWLEFALEKAAENKHANTSLSEYRESADCWTKQMFGTIRVLGFGSVICL